MKSLLISIMYAGEIIVVFLCAFSLLFYNQQMRKV